MILAKFYDCCGYGVLHHLDNWPWESNFVEEMKKKIKKAFFANNRTGLYAIYAQGQSLEILEGLREFGWIEMRKEVNKNTGNMLHTYFLPNTPEIRAKLT